MILNVQMTNVFKEIILSEKLYDTGALYRSIQVYYNLVPPTLYINITSEDYVKYYISDRGLTRQLLNHPVFETEVSGLVFDWFYAQIANGILSPSAPIPNVPNRVRVTYNGV